MEKASKEGGFLTESYGEGKREIKQESGVPGQQGDSFRHGKPYQQGKEVTAREQLQAHGRPGATRLALSHSQMLPCWLERS